jgi:hypothetical protein
MKLKLAFEHNKGDYSYVKHVVQFDAWTTFLEPRIIYET